MLFGIHCQAAYCVFQNAAWSQLILQTARIYSDVTSSKRHDNAMVQMIHSGADSSKFTHGRTVTGRRGIIRSRRGFWLWQQNQ